MIQTHGQAIPAHVCPTCGCKCSRAIDAEICQTKHVLRTLLLKACGQEWQKMRGFDLVSAPDLRTTGKRRANKLRGEGLEAKHREEVKRRYVRKKGVA